VTAVSPLRFALTVLLLLLLLLLLLPWPTGRMRSKLPRCGRRQWTAPQSLGLQNSSVAVSRGWRSRWA
jgi:hypothetical protein